MLSGIDPPRDSHLVVISDVARRPGEDFDDWYTRMALERLASTETHEGPVRPVTERP